MVYYYFSTAKEPLLRHYPNHRWAYKSFEAEPILCTVETWQLMVLSREPGTAKLDIRSCHQRIAMVMLDTNWRWLFGHNQIPVSTHSHSFVIGSCQIIFIVLILDHLVTTNSAVDGAVLTLKLHLFCFAIMKFILNWMSLLDNYPRCFIWCQWLLEVVPK